MLSVPSAFTWPAFGMPTIMPNCCCTDGSEAVALHAAELERRAAILVEIGQDARRLHGLAREAQRRAGAHRAGRLADRRAVLGDQHAGHAVEGAHAREIVLNHGDAGRLAGADRAVQIVDRRLFEAKRLTMRLIHHHAILA